MDDKMNYAQEYCKKTEHVALIDTENVEAMLYNMRAMAFCAGYDKAHEIAKAELLKAAREWCDTKEEGDPAKGVYLSANDLLEFLEGLE